MTPIVLQLQQLAASSDASAGELLRMSRIVATKLGLDDFNQWIVQELHGYPGDVEVPEYRVRIGELQAFNPYNGRYMPVRFVGGEINEKLSTVHFRQPVGELEDLVRETSKGFVQVRFADRQIDVIRQMLDPGDRDWVIPFRKLANTQVSSILDRVRNIILDWALKLEAAGILGTGVTFSDDEKDKAARSQEITIQNFQGIIGDVTQSTVTQNLEMKVKTGDFESLRQSLGERGVEDTDIDELESAIKDDPKPTAPGKFGKRVGAWIGKMVSKAASGALDIGVDVASNVLSSAVTKYYGF